jgi:hypothetical protein
MSALNVPPARANFCCRLNEQHAMRCRLSLCKSANTAIELIAENPNRRHAHHLSVKHHQYN